MREGWVIDKLGNCIKLKSGDGLTAKNMKAGEFPVFGGNGIAGYHIDFNLSGKNIIIGRVGALCGNSRCINEKIWLTDNAFKVSEFKYDFDLEFLNYLLNHIDLRSYARQAAQPVISNSSLKDVPLTFPKSLQEQKQIVAILDQAFAAIDQAKTNIEKNMENAKELFQSKLNTIFSQKSEGWEEKTLGEVCKIINGGTPKTKVQEYWDGDIAWITPADMGKQDTKYVTNTRRNITELGLSKSSAKLFQENSVILSTRAPIGHLVINEVPMSTNQGCRGVVPNQNISTLFIYYFLLSNVTLLNDLGTGTTFKELSTKALSSVMLNIPLYEIQEEVAKQIELLEFKLSEILNNYKQKLENIEDLKKSILQKAFAGELSYNEDTIPLKQVAEPMASYSKK